MDIFENPSNSIFIVIFNNKFFLDFILDQDNPNLYLSKETFLQSGYGLPSIKGSPLQALMNKL